jgi:hypothetical protein
MRCLRHGSVSAKEIIRLMALRNARRRRKPRVPRKVVAKAQELMPLRMTASALMAVISPR